MVLLRSDEARRLPSQHPASVSPPAYLLLPPLRQHPSSVSPPAYLRLPPLRLLPFSTPQVYNGARLFMLLVTQLRPTAPIHEYTEEMQCAALGGLFIFLGCANFVTTVRTLLEKGARQSLNKLRRSLASASGRLSPSGRGLAATSTSSSGKEGAASGAGAAPAVDGGSAGPSGFVAAGTGDGLRQRTKSPSRA